MLLVVWVFVHSGRPISGEYTRFALVWWTSGLAHVNWWILILLKGRKTRNITFKVAFVSGFSNLSPALSSVSCMFVYGNTTKRSSGPALDSHRRILATLRPTAGICSSPEFAARSKTRRSETVYIVQLCEANSRPGGRTKQDRRDDRLVGFRA